MNTSIRKSAILSGISLIVMALAAGYGYGYIFDQLIDMSNPEATLNSLQNNKTFYGSGIGAWLLILLTDLIVAWGLYRFYKPVNEQVSLLTGLLRGIYSVILAIAIYQLVVVWNMLGISNPSATELVHQVGRFESIWNFGLIVFGIHLIGIGWLSIKSAVVPKWLAVLLLFAGVCYTLLSGAKAMFPEASSAISMAELILGAPMAIAELGLAIWLIWKGGKRAFN